MFTDNDGILTPTFLSLTPEPNPTLCELMLCLKYIQLQDAMPCRVFTCGLKTFLTRG